MAFIQFQFRRGTAAEWSSANPILASGEIGVETDTSKFKVGNGTDNWNTLTYGGLIGASGYSGISGYSGFSGISGYSGESGTSGYSGFSGISGYSGFSGISGATGMGFTIAKTYASVATLTADTSPTGITAGQFAIIDTGDVENSENSRLYLWNGSVYQYTSDLSGAQGIKGESGISGFSGFSGISGYSGFSGISGTNGESGFSGISGWSGISGYSGWSGISGASGPSTVINATNDTSTTTLYPVMTAAAGSNQTPKVDTSANAFVYNASTETLNINKIIPIALYPTRVAGGTGGSYTFDLATANYFSRTVNTASTFAVSNVTASGTVSSFVLDLTNGGSAAITWWANLKWAAGTAPTLTSAGRDILGFFTHDGGTTWNGLVLTKDIK